MPGQRDVVLTQRQPFSGADEQLQLDEVDAGDFLGHGVFDLQTGVHLHEEELVGTVGADDELDGAGSDVAHGLRGLAGGLADAGSGRLVEQCRGRLFDDLLVAPLQRALTLAEVDDVAVGVGHDLDLDVARGGHESFEEESVVAEGARGLTAGRLQRFGQLLGLEHRVHAFASASGGGFDEHGEPDIGRGRDQGFVAHGGVLRAGHERDSAGGYGLFGGDLVAHGPDGVRVGAEEDDAGGLAGRGELSVLRQESVAGVDGFGPGGPSGVDDLVDAQIRFGGGGRAQVHGGVGGLDVGGVGIGVGVDGDGSDPEPTAGADDAQGDLSAVGDEYSLEHRGAHILKTP